MSTTTTSPESLTILIKYLRENFYTTLNGSEPSVTVLYNTILYDLITILPVEQQALIPDYKVFSDYIALVSDSTNKFSFDQDPTIGIIYIDNTADEPIIVAHMPTRNTISIQARKQFLSSFPNNKFFLPFWVSNKKTTTPPHKIPDSQVDTQSGQTNAPVQSEPATIPDSPEQLARGNKMIETAIEYYCAQTHVPRDTIKDIHAFLDHLLPDIFKYKITVSEEQQMQEDAKHLDTKYPEVLLKCLAKMGYLQ